MKEVQLDIVSPDIKLPDCLGIMQRAGRSAVVVANDDGPVLITAETITKAMNRAVDQGGDPAEVAIGTVRPLSLQPSFLPDLPTASMRAPSFSFDDHAQSALRRMFDERDDRHIVFPTSDETKARVVTSSENFASSIGSALTICRCAGPRPEVHTFTRNEVEQEGVCNYPHKASLTCDDI